MRALKPIRAVTTALLLAAAMSAPVAAGALSADLLARISIENFGQVSDTFFRGAQPYGQDYDDLKAIGVRTIIDLQNDGDPSEASAAQRAGLKFFRVPMSSTSVPSAAQLDQFLRLVSDPSNQPVYVHCKGGRHRTGTLTAVYRMSHDGWTADRAYEEMLKYDFDYGFGHGGQKKFVYAYSRDLERARGGATAKATAQQ